jgi:hypothetical protein
VSVGEITVTDMTAFENAVHDDDIVVHWYPTNRRYRRSGNAHPQPGDIAWCGHVKRRPYQAGPFGGLPKCQGCLVLRGMRS